jgi:hypothetical protein
VGNDSVSGSFNGNGEEVVPNYSSFGLIVLFWFLKEGFGYLAAFAAKDGQG